MLARALLFGFLIVALSITGTSARADADSLKILNALRNGECGQRTTLSPLKSNRQLDAAARLVIRGQKMKEAIKRTGYRADQTAMIHLSGTMDDAAIKRVLIKNYCKSIIEPGLSEAGIARDNDEIAIVLAAPFAPPAGSDAAKVADQVLRFVNDARAKPRKCGAKSFHAVPSLTLNATLAVAARAHAKDMAARREISHSGSDGSTPDERVSRTGYAWKAVGENVASGQLSAREVVDGWLSSPHHCENIMDADFTQMAVAYVVGPKNETGIYWAQVFARPR